MMVAIDFTGSNGPCTDARSLHYSDKSGVRLNPYQTSISMVGTVLQEYDSDKKFPVYGFGARWPLADGTLSSVSHCFNIPFSSEKRIEVTGVSGILDAYAKSVDKLQFSGPTLFAPIIRESKEIAKSYNCNQSNQKYGILLIITDGVINDFEETKSAIIAASQYPLSIVIVGVGNN